MQTVLHIFLLAIVYPQKLQHLLILNAKALPTSLFSESSHHHHAMDLGQLIIPITPPADLSMEPALVLKRKNRKKLHKLWNKRLISASYGFETDRHIMINMREKISTELLS